MSLTQNLEYDRYYHIYSRGINGTNIFNSETDFEYFLKLMAKYLLHTSEIFAWALMSNHFHLLIRVKAKNEINHIKSKLSQTSQDFKILSNNYSANSSFWKENKKDKKYIPTNQISHLLSTYVLKFNKLNNRHGSLFEKPFKRKLITNREYFKELVFYIHNNPVKHKIRKSISNYKYTSFHSILSDKNTNISRSEVIKWFGSKQEFVDYHQKNINLDNISDFLIDYD